MISFRIVATLWYVPCFVELSRDHKNRDDLQDERYNNEEKDENTKHLVLEALLGVVGHEEREADKQ